MFLRCEQQPKITRVAKSTVRVHGITQEEEMPGPRSQPRERGSRLLLEGVGKA